MTFDFDSIIGPKMVELTCPGCGHKFQVKMQNISQNHSSITCPCCNKSIRIEHNNSFSNAVTDINRSFKNLEDTIKKLGK